MTDEQIRKIESEGEPKRTFDILSPVSGTVIQRYVAVGDYIQAGGALFKVADLTSVWIMLDAYESDLPWIRQGDPVTFAVQSFPGKSYRGRVDYIDPILDTTGRIARVRVETENPARALKPGMFVHAELISRQAMAADALLIPKSAVLWTGKRAIVYVKVPDRETGSFLHREITLGPEAGVFYTVSDGLSEGEIVASNGVFKIDASAQLAGKTSMMHPKDPSAMKGHDHKGRTSRNGPMEPTDDATPADMQHEVFRVSGSCGMCKARIEETTRGIEGVKRAEWHAASQMLHVAFNRNQVQLRGVHEAIARAGHDTDRLSAPDTVYEQLPMCCHYREE